MKRIVIAKNWLKKSQIVMISKHNKQTDGGVNEVGYQTDQNHIIELTKDRLRAIRERDSDLKFSLDMKSNATPKPTWSAIADKRPEIRYWIAR